VFNQSKELWAGLEDYLLDIAATTEPRMTVFTAPVLAANDPPYRGIRLPRFFWKIAVWLRGNVLAATGYWLSQDELLPAVLATEFPELAWVDEVEPGGYRTYQVPIPFIFQQTGIVSPGLLAADVLAGTGQPDRYGSYPYLDLLTSYSDIRLG